MSLWRIGWRHVLPNASGPIIVAATLRVAEAIILESTLSFIGLGIQPPLASLGSMLQKGLTRLLDAPWMVWFPGLLIALTVFAFNFVGDGIRDALDPKQILLVRKGDRMRQSEATNHAAALHRDAIVIDGHSDILMAIADRKMRLGDRVELPPHEGWQPPLGWTDSAESKLYDFSPHTSYFQTMGQYDIPRFLEGGLTAQACAIYLERRPSRPAPAPRPGDGLLAAIVRPRRTLSST